MSYDGLTSTGCILNQRGLSENERSENALLRSRIDEQSQLIMALKQHVDEASQTVDWLNKRNATLAADCKQARDDLAVQRRKYDLLESRFGHLSSNHQQMIEVSLLHLLICLTNK